MSPLLIFFIDSFSEVTNFKILSTESSLKTNLNILICRIYLKVFEQLFIINKNIIPLQRKFREKLKMKILRNEQLDVFLKFQKGNYLNFRNENNVKLRWTSEKEKYVELYLAKY